MNVGESSFKFLLTAALLGSSAFARAQSSEFAHCNGTERELAEANTNLGKEQRLRALEQITGDIRKIVGEMDQQELGTSPFPKSLLVTCRKRKVEILQIHLKSADPSTKDHPVYFRVQGIVHWLNAKLSPATRLQELTDAYEKLGKAVEKNEKDWSSKADLVKVYLELNIERMKNSTRGNFSPSDVDQFYARTQKMVDDMAKDSSIPLEIRISTIKGRTNWVKIALKHKSIMIKDFQTVLALSPNDQESLITLGFYYYKLGNYTDAVTYLGRLQKLNGDLPAFAEPYIDSLLQLKDYNGVIVVGRQSRLKMPNSAMVASRLARALLVQGKVEEARIENAAALKLSPTDSFAQITESQILEIDGDALAEKKMLSSAIQQYDAAYKLDANRPILRRKMSLIVYENRRQKNFEPKATALQEMKFITELLDPVKNRPEVGPDGVEILIYAAEFCELAKLTCAACEQFEKDYGPFTSANTIRSCANAYALSGKKDQAVKLLKFSMLNKKFEDSRPKFKELLLRLE